jgi:hypothetical protein
MSDPYKDIGFDSNRIGFGRRGIHFLLRSLSDSRFVARSGSRADLVVLQPAD